MNILILSFYFRPDLSAGSFRAAALVQALQHQIPKGSQIEVLTTLPNRYNSFSEEAPASESSDSVAITRFALPAHRSGMIDQAKAFIAFARAVLRHTRKKQYDLVFATSGRLMTAVLAAWVVRRKKALLYLDIRDIFVDTIKDVLPVRFALLARPVFGLLERWAIMQADKINLVSRGFSGYFEMRYPEQDFSYFTNGIDDEFLSVPSKRKKVRQDGAIKVVYAGNLGEGQGLHLIVPELAKRMRGKIHFTIIGDGGRKDALLKALNDIDVDNVELLPPMNRAQLVEAYQAADILFLHLNNYDAFKKVLPSKLFEYGAIGKPIWAGVSGYAAEFIKHEISNAAIFNPCNSIEAEEVFSSLAIMDSRRHRFVDKFARVNLMKEMADNVLSLVQAKATSEPLQGDSQIKGGIS